MKTNHSELTKRGSTLFLRLVVFAMGGVALLLAAVILPELHMGWGDAFPEFAHLKYAFLLTLTATTVPFFIALYQTLRLLGYIDTAAAFSEKSVEALGIIKYCAIAFSALYAAILPLFYAMGDNTDAPGLIVIGMIMTFAPMVIAVFAAVLQRLLQNAIDIKSENDLTV